MTAHILIVDDEPRVAEPLSFALQREHFRVTHVERGEQALAVLAADAPALMVLDVGLPDINGFDVLKRVRRDSEVPVLFLTAREDELDRILGLELGGDDYVTKPFSPARWWPGCAPFSSVRARRPTPPRWWTGAWTRTPPGPGSATSPCP
ncbi:Alkaline phosphatase synthesis transcriptional regulatory protein PhoP [Alcanivorax sp. ALC70]|nr:Alkaline phosphatase synthesis transcriptional regulatory protein PhoP [Alcanivorax sp. ALC70]